MTRSYNKTATEATGSRSTLVAAQPGITDVLHETEAALDAIGDSIGELSEALGPILEADEPRRTDEEGEDSEGTDSMALQYARRLRRIAFGLNRRVRNLTERVQL